MALPMMTSAMAAIGPLAPQTATTLAPATSSNTGTFDSTAGPRATVMTSPTMTSSTPIMSTSLATQPSLQPATQPAAQTSQASGFQPIIAPAYAMPQPHPDPLIIRNDPVWPVAAPTPVMLRLSVNPQVMVPVPASLSTSRWRRYYPLGLLVALGLSGYAAWRASRSR